MITVYTTENVRQKSYIPNVPCSTLVFYRTCTMMFASKRKTVRKCWILADMPDEFLFGIHRHGIHGLVRGAGHPT